MPLTLLHTSAAHQAAFDALRDRIAPGVALTHLVREDFLSRAQRGIDAALNAEIMHIVQGCSGPVLCTCSTIGDIARNAGALRIDQPMMRAAAQAGGPILMVYCLQSTLAPSIALLEEELAREAAPRKVHALFLGEYWPLFESGETGAFSAAIAAAIREAARRIPGLACAVLAQASMTGAAPLLDDLDMPVLASPELALRAALALQR